MYVTNERIYHAKCDGLNLEELKFYHMYLKLQIHHNVMLNDFTLQAIIFISNKVIFNIIIAAKLACKTLTDRHFYL